MKFLAMVLGIFTVCFTLGAAQPFAEEHGSHAPHWTYEGNTGPGYWPGLNPDFGAAIGCAQSPIDIETNAATGHYGKDIQVHYRNGAFTILNNGHTVQISPTVKEDNYVMLGGVKYTLQQLHFHVPSEHRTDGVTLPMEVHFVNKSDAGRLAVMGMYFDKGAPNNSLSSAWDAMPVKSGGGEMPLRQIFQIEGLLPNNLANIQYNGSLTTPPTAEGVLWIVLRNHAIAAEEQIAKFNRAIGNNARPVQPLNGRLLYSGDAAKE